MSYARRPRHALRPQHALRPYATAGIAIVGASLIAVTPMAGPPAPPVVQTPEVELTAADVAAEAFAILIYSLDPGSFSSDTYQTATDYLGQIAVLLDNFLDLGGTPLATATNTYADDVLGWL